MSNFKSQQRHLILHGRSFHFVSYEGSAGSRRSAQLPYPALWYLMVEGRRCPVFPCDESWTLPELDALLLAWAEEHAFGEVDGLPNHPGPSQPIAARAQRNWWGPT